jgi:hypothetical protein
MAIGLGKTFKCGAGRLDGGSNNKLTTRLRSSTAQELPQKCPQMSSSSSFIDEKPLQPRGEAWRLSQRSLVDESSL